MKDFLFFRGVSEKSNVVDLNQTTNGIISQNEYNRNRDIAAHEEYMRRYYELMRQREENRREQLNQI